MSLSIFLAFRLLTFYEDFIFRLLRKSQISLYHLQFWGILNAFPFSWNIIKVLCLVALISRAIFQFLCCQFLPWKNLLSRQAHQRTWTTQNDKGSLQSTHLSCHSRLAYPSISGKWTFSVGLITPCDEWSPTPRLPIPHLPVSCTTRSGSSVFSPYQALRLPKGTAWTWPCSSFR